MAVLVLTRAGPRGPATGRAPTQTGETAEILGTRGAMQIIDPGIMALPRQFYRLSVEP
jgi:hypothetical protein